MRRAAGWILALAGVLFAQPAAGPAGHWEGAIQTPGGDLNFEIDLATESGGNWIGTISVPAQNTKGLRLTSVTVKDNAITFSVRAPGDPIFQGTLAKDGAKISGQLSQGGGEIPFQLTRTGDAKIERQVPNPPFSKELEGTWEGTLDAGGQQLRLRFVLSNQGGAGTGTLFSLDQGNVEIPVEHISQAGPRVTMQVPVVNGGFEGDLKGGQIAGTWSQGGNSFPLTVTKAK